MANTFFPLRPVYRVVHDRPPVKLLLACQLADRVLAAICYNVEVLQDTQ